MSPTTATQFVASRIGSSKRRSGLRRSQVHGSGHHGSSGLGSSGLGSGVSGPGRAGSEAPRLRLVRNEGHPTVATRHPVRPVRLYRSELSVRTSPPGSAAAGLARVRVVDPSCVVAGSGEAGSVDVRSDRGPGSRRSVRPVPTGRAGTPRARSAEAPVRLTRRGRLVVRVGSAGLVVLTLMAGVLLLDRTAEAGSTVTPVPVSYRVVLPGETLWQIAGEIAPTADRRDTVAEILELNALPTGGVDAGQRIAVPLHAP